MKFFFDNNLSQNLVRGMECFGEDVMHLKDKFAQDTPDVEWLEYIGRNGYVLITRDQRVRWNPAEKGAIRKHRVGVFFLGGREQSSWQIIQQVIRNWHRIKEYAEKERPPYGFLVPPKGSSIKPIPLW